MNDRAQEAFIQHRLAKGESDRQSLEAEALKSRQAFIDRSYEAFGLALEGDRLQHEEIREIDKLGDTGVYQFNHYILSADEDEQYVQLGADFVRSVIIGFARAVQANQKPVGDQMFLVLPVPANFVLHEQTTVADIDYIREVCVLLSCPSNDSVADEYYYISENGIRPTQHIEDNNSEQQAQIEQIFANVEVKNFLPATLNRPFLAKLRDDLAEMIPMPLRTTEIDLSQVV